MPITEINFDGIVGPSHNYAGLSFGNVASMGHGGQVSEPRAAALQGIEKMRSNLALGLRQGILLPHPRPNDRWLARLGTTIEDAEPALAANAMSASSMWAANAATVSPASDAADSRCHLTVANLRTMPHRSHEWRSTLDQLSIAFRDVAHFQVHPPVPAAFGDEGAANHMRLASAHEETGVEIFVYGVSGGGFPARQHIEASKAIARLHKLDPSRTIFVQQSEQAIAAGAFHNDVVAVANERVLLAHEQAFANKHPLLEACEQFVPGFEYVEVPELEVPLEDAIKSYLFNAQLVTPPDGQMTLILPSEARAIPSVSRWLDGHLRGNGPIRRVEVVDVRQSMANGGGPACLRLRVVADHATVDPRFLVDDRKLDAIHKVVSRYWPEQIAHDDLQQATLVGDVQRARAALLQMLDLVELA